MSAKLVRVVTLTLSSKGSLVLPAGVRKRLRLKARTKLELKELDGGVFLRPAGKSPAFSPIVYPPPGTLKVSKRMLELDRLAGFDAGPGDP